jgi:hypothetical protein
MGDIMGGARAARAKSVQAVQTTEETIDTSAIETRGIENGRTLTRKPARVRNEPALHKKSDLVLLEEISDVLKHLSRARRQRILRILGAML